MTRKRDIIPHASLCATTASNALLVRHVFAGVLTRGTLRTTETKCDGSTRLMQENGRGRERET